MEEQVPLTHEIQGIVKSLITSSVIQSLLSFCIAEQPRAKLFYRDAAVIFSVLVSNVSIWACC